MDLERLGNDEHLLCAAIEVNKAADALASMITEDGTPPQQQQPAQQRSVTEYAPLSTEQWQLIDDKSTRFENHASGRRSVHRPSVSSSKERTDSQEPDLAGWSGN
jgi:hypothetical protein